MTSASSDRFDGIQTGLAIKAPVRIATGNLMILSGSGSPAGAASAGVGSIYVDGSGSAGAVGWLKASGSGTSGWEKITSAST